LEDVLEKNRLGVGSEKFWRMVNVSRSICSTSFIAVFWVESHPKKR
jgi:hypothetical protein